MESQHASADTVLCKAWCGHAAVMCAGWFQSSLLTSVAATGKAPYQQVRGGGALFVAAFPCIRGFGFESCGPPLHVAMPPPSYKDVCVVRFGYLVGMRLSDGCTYALRLCACASAAPRC